MGVFCLSFLSRMANFKPLRLFMRALQLLFFFSNILVIAGD